MSQNAKLVQRYEDRRPARRRHPARPRERFEYLIKVSNTPGTLRTDQERIVAAALSQLDLTYGIEVVSFQIVRQGRHNGKLGAKVPDFWVHTESGVVFLELSGAFTAEEEAAFGFLRSRYGLQIVTIDELLSSAIASDARTLRRLIDEAEASAAQAPANSFCADIVSAARACEAIRQARGLSVPRSANARVNGVKPARVPRDTDVPPHYTSQMHQALLASQLGLRTA